MFNLFLKNKMSSFIKNNYYIDDFYKAIFGKVVIDAHNATKTILEKFVLEWSLLKWFLGTIQVTRTGVVALVIYVLALLIY